MIKIIKHGSAYIDKSIQLICKVCQCVFEITNPETENKIVFQDQEDQRNYVAIHCPECNSAVEIRVLPQKED